MDELKELRKEYDFPIEKPNFKPDTSGWFRVENSAMLRMMLTDKTKVVLEIGSLFGLSTRNICNFAPNSTVIAVDTWKGSPNFIDWEYFNGKLDNLYEIFIVSCWDYKNRIIPIKADSITGMKIIHKFGIHPDLIYIDGSHEYDDVVNDIQTAKKLFPNSVLCGDDYEWETVKKAVNENGNATVMGGFWWFS